ncbi:tetratricopeptide repeat protein [Acetobacter persici]|uniref:hypothetical protein n=1 Tax=Acetobacter persici TaxID=1076596 RepID=UPI001F1780F2|nr:hypothetical protein [Acetobacter persici]MCG0997475.1 hypothetical protein [Acetobacter persici]
MKRVAALILLAPLFLAGCGGGAVEGPSARDDAAWDQAMTAGQDSFELGRYSVAITQYRRAADLALLRDDGVAAAEAGYDLAVAQLAGDDPAAAVKTVQTTRQAAALRGQTAQPEFDLIEAAARYRLRQYPQAVTLASGGMNAADRAYAARSALVLGLAADAGQDRTAFQKALIYFNALKPPLSRTEQADKAEIQARAVLASSPVQAEQLAEQAATLRRDEASYRDMARALALAGQAADRSGDHQKAASFWARAAQSASMQAKSANTADAATVTQGETLLRGGATSAQGDAAEWAHLAGGVSLHPFAEPKAQ